jgi:sec-independent protein translocase protein TatA
MELGWPELLIIFVIVILLFGVGRIGKIAGELGSGVRAFRDGLKSDDDLEGPKVEVSETPKKDE